MWRLEPDFNPGIYRATMFVNLPIKSNMSEIRQSDCQSLPVEYIAVCNYLNNSMCPSLISQQSQPTCVKGQ